MQKIDRLRTLTRQEIQKVRFVFAPTPVSYTHLDVYKRQVEDRRERCGGRR